MGSCMSALDQLACDRDFATIFSIVSEVAGLGVINTSALSKSLTFSLPFSSVGSRQHRGGESLLRIGRTEQDVLG